MAKLSPAQDKAIRGLSKGEFPLGTNKRTIEALVNNGYVMENNTFYDLTATGREYLGVETVTVDDVLAELNTNPWDVVPSLPAGWAMTPHNRKAWEDLTEEEIRADIATARPVANRKDIRSGNVLKSKHF